MVRSYWKATLVIALLGCGLAWGQQRLVPTPVSPYGGQLIYQPAPEPVRPVPVAKPLPVGPATINPTVAVEPIRPVPASNPLPAAPAAINPNERIITVTEPGKPPQQCRVLREWRLTDGNTALEVQALDTGEKMTIVESAASVATEADAYPATRGQGVFSRIFRWGQDQFAPAGAPTAPLMGDSNGTMVASPVEGMPGMAPPSERPRLRGPFNFEEYLASLRGQHLATENTGSATVAMPTDKTPIFGAKGMLAGKGTKMDMGPSLGDDKDAAAKSFWGRWFGGSSKETVAKESVTKESVTKDSVTKEQASASKSSAAFDRDKYLADLRAKKSGKDVDGKEVDKKETKVADNAANKPAAKPPTVTAPKLPDAVASKTQTKPAVENAQPSDWRKSWGKSEAQAKDDAKAKDEDKAKTDKKAEETAKAKPAPKKELPAAPLRSDPLLEPERYSKRPEIKAETSKATAAAATPSPLMSSAQESAKPAPEPEKAKPAPASMAKVEPPAKASTIKVPLGAGSIAAAYENLQPGQVYYLPVPMVTVPPTAHTIRPPQVPTSLPPQVNEAMVNAFSGGGAVMPTNYEQSAMAPNAFCNGQPMMDPSPMGYMAPPMMPTNPYGPMAQAMGPAGYSPMMGMPGMMPPAMMGAGGMAPQAMMGAPAMVYPGAMPVPQPAAPAADPQAASQLIQTLRDALYPSQREYAAEALAALDWRTHPQVFDALLTAARDDPAATVRMTCVRCLSSMNVNSSLVAMTFESLKSDSDPRVRNEVEQALAKLPQPKTTSPVQPAGAVVPEK
jgi:hypothetical protein